MNPQATNPSRLAIINAIEHNSPSTYDLSSYDDNGLPTLMVGGLVPSKQQEKKMKKALVIATKQVMKKLNITTETNVTVNPDITEKSYRCPNPGCEMMFASEKQFNNHECECLPMGYWEAQSMAVNEATKTGGGAIRLGIDVGGVIAVPNKHNENDGDCIVTSHSKEDTVLTNAVITEECFVAVKTLVSHFGADNVFIVSKAGDRMEANTRTWLLEKGFYSRTGLREDHVLFCKSRSQKRPIVDAIGITHFIDDRWSVMKHLDNCQCRFLFPNEKDNSVPRNVMQSLTLLKVGWSGVLSNMGLL